MHLVGAFGVVFIKHPDFPFFYPKMQISLEGGLLLFVEKINRITPCEPFDFFYYGLIERGNISFNLVK